MAAELTTVRSIAKRASVAKKLVTAVQENAKLFQELDKSSRKRNPFERSLLQNAPKSFSSLNFAPPMISQIEKKKPSLVLRQPASLLSSSSQNKMNPKTNLVGSSSGVVTGGALRNLQTSAVTPCDVSFLSCMTVPDCFSCFMEMQTNDIDWATVTQGTPCIDVVDALVKNDHCTNLKSNTNGMDQFCKTFSSCVVWDDDAFKPGTKNDDDGKFKFDDDGWFVDCSSLTECNWEGYHPSFIGNGICNDYACYNTAICGFDGGDCCEDTCETRSTFVECGHDGYACRDPTAKNCDSSLTALCPATDDATNSEKNGDDGTHPVVECTDSGNSPYRLIMYDSFGDGWDATKITISPADSSGEVNGAPIYKGSLETGSEGTKYICLSKFPSCYHVAVKGGVWGNEVSWEVKPMTAGAPAIAGGGAPMECNFGSAGGTCDEHTCSGNKPNIEPSNDPEYKELKDLHACIDKTCVIQVEACHKDEVCDVCFAEKAADYCYGNDAFNAVVDCSLCNCMDTNASSFCESKAGPGSKVLPPSDKKAGQDTRKDCSPAETLQGGAAVMEFSNCTNFDQVAMMVTDFDQNNFGDLDSFESCAHSYASDSGHGGHTALGCLKILVNAMSAPATDLNVPTEAIRALASLLYHGAEDFCDCAKDASDLCPFCSSFVKFKTLLYESLDACQSLDEIDCDAWNEFYPICSKNVEMKFGNSDFRSQDQCDYLREGCGGAGPFPTFRRLDCDKELPKESWDFYTKFAMACVTDFNPNDGRKTEVPAPVAPIKTSSPTVTAGVRTTYPAPKPYTPPSGGGSRPAPKPYVPPEDRGNTPPADSKSSESSTTPSVTKKKKSGWFWKLLMFCMIGGVVYYWYKRRADGFNFVRYRRMRNNFMGMGDDNDMYSGLALESSTNFEPPSLPAPPHAMGGSQMFS